MLMFALMCKLPFNIILPREIIHHIYIFYLREKSRDTILYHYKSIQEKTSTLKNVIHHMVYFDTNYINIQNNININIISNINIILNNEFSREIYPHEFWQHLLHLISVRLMYTYNHFCIIGNNKRTNADYNLFLQMIDVWFKLCIKHNIKLYISRYEDFNKTVITRMELNAKKMLPIKNLNKYVYTPTVILNNGEHIDIEYAREILKYYLVE